MKSLKRLSFVILVVVLSLLNFSSKTVLAEGSNPVSKFLKVNNTTLEFKEIVYIDGTNGNDTTGDGSKNKPFKTVVKGFDYLDANCREDGAIIIKDGTYDVSNIFKGNSNNLNARYNKMKISLLAETMGKVSFTNVKEWMVIENNYSYRIKVSLYGIIFKSTNAYYHLAGDNWMNEFYNCVIAGGYGGVHGVVSDANIKVENCLFLGSPSSKYYIADSITGSALNSASTSNSIDPYRGTKTNCLYNVTVDSNYNITSSGWKNAGIGQNPDGTTANIGVYGGQFAWGSKVEEISNVRKLKVVLEVKEQLQLSVDEDLDENLEMIWTSSNDTVATVDANGVVTALAPGNTMITVTSGDGTYTDYINVLVVDDAKDYRLAVDLKVGKTCRLTVDDLTDTVKVNWSSLDLTVATVSSKGKVTAVSEGLTVVIATDEEGNEIGQIYIRVRE
ncbi:hypothetical protein acsn021_09100 [Anaerocolumna cellulosilytica]|uniref:Uncharacterized protein n=1 Tax=Anaerocolumna cellulosilytica TaxID=433286 RepID=A0A6S6R2D0_9FIRM|nr:Ig-like domain-containing protein [Anaerocolumna cellulosilytica]MBB5194396.1 hypothetical protein [Anaerocolumna cellulosilytica]BCJ93341.1 hypothetical protein acsn021_09100 [Anaerocolumna cellulosilytica]